MKTHRRCFCGQFLRGRWIFLIKDRRRIEWRSENHVPMVVPGFWCAEGDPTNALGDPHKERAPGIWLRDLPEQLQPLTGRLPEGASSSPNALRAVVDRIIPAALPPPPQTSGRPSSNKPGGKHNHIHSCSKTPELRGTQAYKAHCERLAIMSLGNRTDRIPKAEYVVM